MKSLEKWLLENGYNFKKITLSDGNTAIMVNTDYEGMYAPKEVYTIHETIRKHLKRCRTAFKTESRGSHTALLITV